MGTPVAVHWHEGLFLRPQHLQMLQKAVFDAAIAERRLGCPYPYGVVSAELDEASLENMLVRYRRLSVVMPGGVYVNYPDEADLASLNIEEAFNASTDPLTICLAVPKWDAARPNTIDLESPDDWRTGKIYRVAEVERADENTGKNEQPVQIRKINARLQLSTTERTDLDVVPILKVDRGMTADNAAVPRPDPEFIPPLMVAQAHAPLMEKVRDIINLIDVAKRQLYLHLRPLGSDLKILALGVQFERWERLKVLNAYAGRLPSLAAAPAVTPLELYLELRRLQGEMAAFYPGRPEYFECPHYNHDNLAVSFQDLFKQLRNMVPMLLGTEPLKAKFGPETNRMRIAELTQEHLSKPTKYYLAIETRLEPAALDKLVSDRNRFKMLSRSQADFNVWGLRLQYEKFLPPDLVYKPNRHYFSIYRGVDDVHSARAWDKIKVDRQIVARWPDMTGSDFDMTIWMTVPPVDE